MQKKLIKFPFPIFSAKEDKWFIAECPVLGVATQGRTEKEVKENITDLIQEYLEDPDTVKPKLKDISYSSLSYIPIGISKNLLYGQA